MRFLNSMIQFYLTVHMIEIPSSRDTDIASNRGAIRIELEILDGGALKDETGQNGMQQLLDVSLHEGPEMERAINRTDFFRLFKSVTRAYGFDLFLVFRHTQHHQGLRAHSDFLLTNLPESQHAAAALAMTSAPGDLLQLIHRLSTPFFHKLQANFFDRRGPAGWGKESRDFMFVPLYAPDGKRYCLLLGGERALPLKRETAEILLDSLRVFNKYYDKIITSETSPTLTARETEVVRWTSEGKTSAEIAIILGLSEHTVISHITASARKLNAVNRTHMIAIAIKKGIVS